MDAVVVHSEHGRARLVDAPGVDAAQGPRHPARRVRAPDAAARRARCRPSCARGRQARRPVLRPAASLQGLDVLLEAWRALEPTPSCGSSASRGWTSRRCERARRRVRWIPRFVDDAEIAAFFRRADLVVLPYREIDQSGVLFTALAFGTPLVLSAVGGFPRGRRPRRRGARPARRRGRAGAELGACSATTPSARSSPPAPARPRPGATRGTRSPRRTSRSTSAALSVRRQWPVIPWESLLAVVALLAYTQVGYPRCSRCSPGCGARARPSRRAGDELPTVSLIVAAYDEDAVIGAKVADALALDYPREQLEVIVASDGPTDATVLGRAAPAPTSCSTSRAAARSARRTPRCAPRGDLVAFSDANARGSPTRCARSSRVRRPAGRLRLRPGPLRQRRRDEPGGPVLALRDGAARARVAAVLGHRGQRRDLRDAPRGLHRVDPIMGHDLSFPFNMVKRGWRAVYVPSASATEKMVPRSRASSRASGG